MSSALAIHPNDFQHHAAQVGDLSAADLFAKAWLDDQASLLMETMVTFFQFSESASGELVMKVFGSGVLVKRREKLLVVTSVSVAEQFGYGDTYMQTALGAVSMKRQICRFDRGQGVAVSDVDKILRANAVLPSWTLSPTPPGGRRGSTSLLCMGFPGSASAFRKSRRPSSFEVKAVMMPYCTGNFIRTSIEQALFLEWGRRTEVEGLGRSIADVDGDIKGMSGGPVFEIVTSEKGDLSSRLLGVMVEFRRDHGLVLAARTHTIEPLLDVLLDRGVR